jgi:hypothetical protein
VKTRWTSLLLLVPLACGGPSSDEAKPAGPNVALAAPAAPAPERVETQRVEAAQLKATIAASGAIEARRITELGSEVPGRIVAVLVDVGDRVEADAPLFRIDPGPYRMALAEAEAGVTLARAENANAQAEATRLKTLLEQNVASQQRSPHSLLSWMRRLIQVRKSNPVFGRGSIEFLYPGNHRVLAFLRQLGNETVLAVNNLSSAAQAVELDLSRCKGNILIEMFGRNLFPRVGDLPYLLTLGPYQFYWFRLRKL